MNQTFQVQGMSCGHCESSVKRAVLGVDPQAEVRVELRSGKVEVRSDAPREKLAEAIAEEGYTVVA